MSKAYGHLCPDCGAPLRIRDSEGMHALMRATVLQCTNDVTCGASFSGAHEIRFRFVPSAKPNPAINLPAAPGWLVKHARQGLQDAQSKTQIDFIEDAETSPAD